MKEEDNISGGMRRYHPYHPGDAGFIFINKPLGLTSHDVVARCRKIFSTKKIGHAGTLDPAATGMLLLGIGRGTKLLGQLALTHKSYSTIIRLGYATDSDDATGERLPDQFTRSITEITDAEIQQIKSHFIGEIWQKPAQISAVKISGKHAYERVRAGEKVEIPARKVAITDYEITRIERISIVDKNYIDIYAHISCSSGTFIRSLARDLGIALEVGGHVAFLHRTSVGPFTQMHTLAELESDPFMDYSLDGMMQKIFPQRELDEAQVQDLHYGRRIKGIGSSEIYCGVGPNGEAVALLEERAGQAGVVFLAHPLTQ